MKNFSQIGDNITVLASQCVFPAHAAGDTYTNLVAPGQGIATPVNLPESGDPVLVGGCLIGVVNNDALNPTDSIVISCRGVYLLSVIGKTTNAANLAVNVGDRLYIDPVTAAITADSTKVPFGQALGAVVAGATTSIPVRLNATATPFQAQGALGGVEVDAASGAIAIKQGTVFITKGSAAAMTLALPISGVDDGKVLTVVCTTAFAHTVATPANGIDGTKTTITFVAAAGNMVELIAFGGLWYLATPPTGAGYAAA